MHWGTTFEDGHIMESKLCPLSVIFRQGQQLRFWSFHRWDLVYVVFWVLCLSVIFKTNLGFFVSDAFQADSEVVVASTDRGHLMLSGRFNSDAILVWDTGEGSDMISRYDMTFGYFYRVKSDLPWTHNCSKVNVQHRHGIDGWGLSRTWRKWRVSWRPEMSLYSWSMRQLAKILAKWHAKDCTVPKAW